MMDRQSRTVFAGLLLFSVCLCCVPQATALNCVFSSFNTGSNSFMDIKSLVACLNAIPFDAALGNDTVTSLIKTFQLYPFKDIATNSPVYANAPYFQSIQVDIDASLESIQAKVQRGAYSSDWAFQQDITLAVAALQDAHITYTRPDCYLDANIILPFRFSSRMEGDKQVVYVHGIFRAILATYPGYIFLSDYVGKTVTTINGKDAMKVIEEFGAKFGISRDIGAAFNYALTKFSIRELQVDYMDSLDAVEISFGDEPISFQWQMFGSSFRIRNHCPQVPSATVSTKTTIHPTRFPLRHFPEEATTRISGNNKRGYDDCTYHESESFSTQSYHDALVIRLTDFSTDIDVNIKAIEEVFNCAKNNDISSVILDLRANGGGYVCDGVALLDKLAPKPDAVYDFRRSPFLDEIKRAKDNHPNTKAASTLRNANFGPIGSGSTYADSRWYFRDAIENVTRGNATSTYSSKISFNVCVEDNIDGFFDKIIVVTDGFCGSTCAFVSTYLKEYHKNVVIYVTGGIKAYPQMSYSAFAGGFVVQKSKISSWLDDLSLPVNDFGGPFDIQIPISELFFNDKSTVPMEFEFRPADQRIWQWDFSSDTELYDVIIANEFKQKKTPQSLPIIPIIIGSFVGVAIVIIIIVIVVRRRRAAAAAAAGFTAISTNDSDAARTTTIPYIAPIPNPQTDYQQQQRPLMAQPGVNYQTMQHQPNPYATASNPYLRSSDPHFQYRPGPAPMMSMQEYVVPPPGTNATNQ